MPESPGGQLAKRPLHFIWIADCSGSMAGTKIASLNTAIKESIKPTQDVADGNPQAEIFVRALKFSDGAQWHVAQPTDIHGFTWQDIQADGCTDMGVALEMVADVLKVENMPQRGLPPVLCLITDGRPTDNFQAGLDKLLAQPWGIKAVRISIAIGEDADLEVLQKFIGNDEVKPLVAHNVQDLVKKIRWVSTAVIGAAAKPASRPPGAPASPAINLAIPAPPPNAAPTSAADVF